MNPLCRFPTIVVLAACTMVPWSSLTAIEPAARLTPREGWSAMFAGRETTLGYAVTSDSSIRGRIVWAYSAQRRTITRGESSANVRSREPMTIEIPLRLPEVRDGITYDTELRVQLVDDRQNIVAEHRRLIRLFSEDTFVDRREWLRRSQIVLYDPSGETEKVFDGAGVPYRSVRSAAALRATTDGMVVIGEGISLIEHPSLPETLSELAAGGLSVLCLAPADGLFAFPGGDDSRPVPDRMSLRRNDVIRELDKRLDADAWPPRGKTVAAALEPTGRHGRVVLSVANSPQAWPWLDVGYPGGGRLIVCGFGVIGSWKAGPTPRYFLFRVFERMSQGIETPRVFLQQE